MTDSDAPSEWGFPNGATPPGSTAYYSIRFAPPALRDDLAALLGWRHEIHGVLEEVSDPGVAAAKLDWWRAELERMARGDGRHPVGRSLQPAIERARLPTGPFLEVIQDRLDLLALRYPHDRTEWLASAERDQGAIAELMARCHGLTHPADLVEARRCGTFCGLVARLRDAGWLIRRGRLGILPMSQLTRAGLMPQTLNRPEAREVLPGLLAEASREVAALGMERDIGLPVTLRIQRRLRRRLLTELEASDFAVLDQRISLTPIRKLWHAWRESRKTQ